MKAEKPRIRYPLIACLSAIALTNADASLYLTVFVLLAISTGAAWQASRSGS